MKKTYNNVDVVVNDPQGKFTDNKAKGGATVTWNSEKSTFNIEFQKARGESDIKVLYGAESPIGIRSKRNNKTKVYSILCNLTASAIETFGQKKIKNELNSAFCAIWNDIIGS